MILLLTAILFISDQLIAQLTIYMNLYASGFNRCYSTFKGAIITVQGFFT